jgi:ribonuclease PH
LSGFEFAEEEEQEREKRRSGRKWGRSRTTRAKNRKSKRTKGSCFRGEERSKVVKRVQEGREDLERARRRASCILFRLFKGKKAATKRRYSFS